MSAKHTPGPWKWNGDGIDGARGEQVLVVDYPSRFSISDADRALIASAPGLLEALTKSLSLLEYMASGRESAMSHKTLVEARAIIAKAEGEK